MNHNTSFSKALLKAFAVLPDNLLTDHSVELGSAIEVLLIALALTDKYREISRQKKASEEETKQVLKEANESLERKVDERTSALQQKQEEIKKDRIALNRSLSDLQTKHQDPRTTIERTKKLFLDSNRAKSEYKSAIPERKREIMYEVLSNALVMDKNILAYQHKSPYDILAGTPKNAGFETMCALRDLN
jgi:flagellar motility protein MotE (MotC chaperone)